MRSNEIHRGFVADVCGICRRPDLKVSGSGTKYESRHHAVHRRPSAPEIAKIQRQFAQLRMTAISGGAMTAPTDVPALIMPIAVERSSVGNHSATARVAAGNPPPSPMPSRNLLTASIAKVIASAWLAHASDQKIMITVKPVRVPRASANFPPPTYMHAYESKNADCSVENCWLERGMSFDIAFTATGSVCRSR